MKQTNNGIKTGHEKAQFYSNALLNAPTICFIEFILSRRIFVQSITNTPKTRTTTTKHIDSNGKSTVTFEALRKMHAVFGILNEMAYIVRFYAKLIRIRRLSFQKCNTLYLLNSKLGWYITWNGCFAWNFVFYSLAHDAKQLSAFFLCMSLFFFCMLAVAGYVIIL